MKKWKIHKSIKTFKNKKPYFKFSFQPIEGQDYVQVLIQTTKISLISKVWNDAYNVIPDIVYIIGNPLLKYLTKDKHGEWMEQNLNNKSNTKLTKQILVALKKKDYSKADELILDQFNETTKQDILTNFLKVK